MQSQSSQGGSHDRTLDALALQDEAMKVLCGGGAAAAAPGGRRRCETNFMASVLLEQEEMQQGRLQHAFAGSVGASTDGVGGRTPRALPQWASLGVGVNSHALSWGGGTEGSRSRSKVYTGVFTRAAPYLAASFLVFFVLMGCCLSRMAMWQPAAAPRVEELSSK